MRERRRLRARELHHAWLRLTGVIHADGVTWACATSCVSLVSISEAASPAPSLRAQDAKRAIGDPGHGRQHRARRQLPRTNVQSAGHQRAPASFAQVTRRAAPAMHASISKPTASWPRIAERHLHVHALSRGHEADLRWPRPRYSAGGTSRAAMRLPKRSCMTSQKRQGLIAQRAIADTGPHHKIPGGCAVVDRTQCADLVAADVPAGVQRLTQGLIERRQRAVQHSALRERAAIVMQHLHHQAQDQKRHGRLLRPARDARRRATRVEQDHLRLGVLRLGVLRLDGGRGLRRTDDTRQFAGGGGADGISRRRGAHGRAGPGLVNGISSSAGGAGVAGSCATGSTAGADCAGGARTGSSSAGSAAPGDRHRPE